MTLQGNKREPLLGTNYLLDNLSNHEGHRVGCQEDCREHQASPTPVFGPQLVQYGRRAAFTTGTVGEGT